MALNEPIIATYKTIHIAWPPDSQTYGVGPREPLAAKTVKLGLPYSSDQNSSSRDFLATKSLELRDSRSRGPAGDAPQVVGSGATQKEPRSNGREAPLGCSLDLSVFPP
jgi:hypothetical protein